MASSLETPRQIELLSEDNYSTWTMQIEALLVKNNLWEYVSGEQDLSSITDDTERAEFLKKDKEARCELILSISASELKHIRHCETSYAMWKELKSVYESRDKAKKRALLKQLILLRSTDDSDMENHVTEFCDIIAKLERMNVEVDEELLVIMFLQSLPRSFDNFKEAIELQKKLPPLEVLKIKLIDNIKERSQKFESESNEPPVSNDFDIVQPLYK